MTEHFELHCPIRGRLKTSARRADGLKPSEEFFRVEAIKYLVALGYPKAHFRIEAIVKKFGNSGRNSLRADFAILDVPATELNSNDVDALMEHAIVLCEVKRETNNLEYVKNTQVKPLLDFSKRDDCIALYWDNVDQRIFWSETTERKRAVREGPLTMLPRYGRKLKVEPITFQATKASDNLQAAFDRIEDLLHTASIDPEQRFHIILQILLVKLFDEHAHAPRPTSEMHIQDYRSLGYGAKNARAMFNQHLAKAVTYYQKYLPNYVSKSLSSKVTGELLLDIAEVIAPIRLIASKREVVQAFYMKFAKGLYKWDLAQYFTPPTVTEFIVDILNPQFGEHIKDPACGSADFLTAAYHRRREVDPGYASCIWGADNSKNAVQVAILNMLLNGDGKTNIKEEDSLELVENEREEYQIMVCNPPFGIRIQERRATVLRKFELGHKWTRDTESTLKRVDEVLDGQEVGILFTELCVQQARKGGRIGIILPNGYLGNRSDRYQIFREWLLRNCRVVAICSFPRFTFKTSGADVSASVVYLEKRKKVLKSANQSDEYNLSIQMIENVGWNLGDKVAAPRYVRSAEDGSYLIDESGSRVLDADFDRALLDIRSSLAAKDFPWLNADLSAVKDRTGWSVPISQILNDPDLTLDPKRYCRKVVELRQSIEKKKHFALGDAVEFINELRTSSGNSVAISDQTSYRYVELQDIGFGDFNSSELRGWELPARAKHLAEPDDLYVGAIWGSVSKWCFIGGQPENLIVTNGCHRLRLRPSKEELLTDILAFLCTEAYAVQMRSFARGSDGLAEVTPDDMQKVLVPILSSAERAEFQPFIEALRAGTSDLKTKVTAAVKASRSTIPVVPARPTHVVLV